MRDRVETIPIEVPEVPADFKRLAEEVRARFEGLRWERPLPEVIVAEREAILHFLERGFKNRYPDREVGEFDELRKALEDNAGALRSISFMIETEGKPELRRVSETSFQVADSSVEAPAKRRNMDFLSAYFQAHTFQVKLLPYDFYLEMQAESPMDLESSSWIATAKHPLHYGHAMQVSSEGFIHMSIEDRSPTKGWRGYVEVPKK